jgi:hypothetical protein
MTNIRTICEVSGFGTSHIPAWKHIVVCLIIPAIDEYDTGVLDVLQTMGVCQERIMKMDVGGKAPVPPHRMRLTAAGDTHF